MNPSQAVYSEVTMTVRRRSSHKMPAVRTGGEALRCSGHGFSDVGKKRASNEDAFYVDDKVGLYVVADGMGGHAAGEVASQEAVEAIYGMVKTGVRSLRELSDPLDDNEVRKAS